MLAGSIVCDREPQRFCYIERCTEGLWQECIDKEVSVIGVVYSFGEVRDRDKGWS